jgi:hypothetical protein
VIAISTAKIKGALRIQPRVSTWFYAQDAIAHASVGTLAAAQATRCSAKLVAGITLQPSAATSLALQPQSTKTALATTASNAPLVRPCCAHDAALQQLRARRGYVAALRP